MLASLLLLASVGTMAYRATLERIESMRSVMHTHVMISSLNELLFRLADAETSWHGVRLGTVRKEDLSQAVTLVLKEQQALRALSADNPEQQRRVAVLDGFVRKRVSRLTANQAQKVGLRGEVEAAEEGAELMEPVRAQFQTLMQAEQRLLQEGEARAQERARASLNALVFGFAFGGALLVLAFAALWRENIHRAELEQAARNEALRAEQAKELAESALRELESFSYSVAHDLRAPLRSIDGFSKVLLEDCEPKLDAAGKEYLGFVVKSANQMAALIDALLSLSRVSGAELHRQPLDLTNMARQVMARLTSELTAGRGAAEQGTASERKLELTVHEGMHVAADPRLLAVLLENLLDNAWKFTRERALTQIEVGMVEGPEPTFFVRDNGAGFDMAYAGKLFGAFQRLHPESEYQGTGIGLATVQRIVQRHGGRIWAEAAVDRGTTVTFSLGKESRDAR